MAAHSSLRDRVAPPLVRGPIMKMPRASELAALCMNSNARTTIGNLVKGPGGKDIWELILAAMDAGFITKHNLGFKLPSLRVLFPNAPLRYCRLYNLSASRDRNMVRDQIFPAALANRDAILAAPDQLEVIIKAHLRKANAISQQAVVQQRVEKKIVAMPAHEKEIIMFGERLWPRIDDQSYDYDQVRAAIWYFCDQNRWLELTGQNVASRAICIRFSTKYFYEYIGRTDPPDNPHKIKRVFHLVQHLAGLMEKNPDGECKLPPTPNTEGKW